MLEFVRKRIGYQLALLFLGVLCLAMGAVVVFNAIYYEDFAHRVVAENEQHVKEQAIIFLEEVTEQHARKYQTVFDKLAATSRMIARQAQLRFQLTDELPKKLVKAEDYLSVRPPNKIFYTDLTRPVMACYWGGTTIPAEVERQLNLLLPIAPVLVEAKEQNPAVVASHLIMSFGGGFYYPNSKQVYTLPPVSELDLRDTNNYVLASPAHNPEQKTIWVPVYFDDVGNGLITTVTTPFFGRHGEFLGVAGLDVPLARLNSEVLLEAHVEDASQLQEMLTILLDERGRIISLPTEHFDTFGIEASPERFSNSADLLNRSLQDSAQAEVRALGAQLREQSAGTGELRLRGVPHIVAWQRLAHTGWQLVTIIPQAAFLEPLETMQAALQERLHLLQKSSYLMALLFFGCAIGVTLLLLERLFIKPLRQITVAAERVQTGNLDPAAASRRIDEIGVLTTAFNDMLAALRHARMIEEEYARQLELQVAEQTRQLQEKNTELEAALDLLQQDILRRQQVETELLSAKTLADAANLAKAKFLANVTHELRTPLIGVLGMNELLAGSALTAEQKALVATVQRCGESLLEIINDVLDFSKVESGEFALEVMDVEIGSLVEQATADLAERAAAKGLHLACRVEPAALWRVMADDLRLRQILLNLIGNAVKFTTQGEISVRLAMMEQSKERGRFLFEVRDTGIGMSEEVQTRIFSPFVQGDDSPVREFGGTGLGLAIVRQLVDRMGGEIALESRVGIGSRFRVTMELPLVAQRCPVLPAALRGTRALLRIEHPFDRDTLSRMLTTLDIDAVSVAGSEDVPTCVATANRQGCPFTFLLVDAESRMADGTRLIEMLYDLPDCAAITIIVVGSPAAQLDKRFPAELVTLTAPVGWAQLMTALGAEPPGFSPELPEQGETPRTSPAPSTGDRPAKCRVLIVDDYAVTRELVCQVLAGDNVEVDQATCGAEALEVMQCHDYALILMDCSMPEMDGMEVTRRLRAEGCRIPIVALTAHIDSRVAEDCRSAGMTDYLAKPFRRKELLDMIDKWLPGVG